MITDVMKSQRAHLNCLCCLSLVKDQGKENGRKGVVGLQDVREDRVEGKISDKVGYPWEFGGKEGRSAQVHRKEELPPTDAPGLREFPVCSLTSSQTLTL